MKFKPSTIFIAGMFFCASILFIRQDWLGLDAYCQSIRAHWINTPWWLWIPMLIASGLVLFVSTYREARNRK